MARFAFDADQRPPQGRLRREKLTRYQAGPLNGFVAPGNLWGERQEQFVKAAFREEVGQQLRAAFGEDQVGGARLLGGFQDSSRAYFAVRALLESDYCC